MSIQYTWSKYETEDENLSDLFIKLEQKPEQRDGAYSYLNFTYSIDQPGADEFKIEAALMEGGEEMKYRIRHPEQEDPRDLVSSRDSFGVGIIDPSDAETTEEAEKVAGYLAEEAVLKGISPMLER